MDQRPRRHVSFCRMPTAPPKGPWPGLVGCYSRSFVAGPPRPDLMLNSRRKRPHMDEVKHGDTNCDVSIRQRHAIGLRDCFTGHARHKLNILLRALASSCRMLSLLGASARLTRARGLSLPTPLGAEGQMGAPLWPCRPARPMAARVAHWVAKDARADHVCTWQNRTWTPKEEGRV